MPQKRISYRAHQGSLEGTLSKKARQEKSRLERGKKNSQKQGPADIHSRRRMLPSGSESKMA